MQADAMGVPWNNPKSKHQWRLKNEKWIDRRYTGITMNVLCLKLRNRHAVWNPAAASAYYEDAQSNVMPTEGQNTHKLHHLRKPKEKEYT